MRSFVKIKPSRIGNIGKSCPVHEFFTSQICLLTLFAKIKLSQKFPNTQYLLYQSQILKSVSEIVFISKYMYSID